MSNLQPLIQNLLSDIKDGKGWFKFLRAFPSAPGSKNESIHEKKP